jgi:hypothetical protein
MRGTIAALVLSLAASATAQEASFDYDPKPRWAAEPDTGIVCAAIRAECPGTMGKDDSVEADWGYAEIYDADGMLIGVHSTESTGCKPLDESELLSHRHFKTMFSKAGQPDLDDVTVELKPGTAKDAVRLVKRSSTHISMGC